MIIKLNKQVEQLEQAKDRLQEKIQDLQDKIIMIEDNADDHDRELTSREEIRIAGYEEDIDILCCEQDDIQNAIDYLKDYCE